MKGKAITGIVLATTVQLTDVPERFTHHQRIADFSADLDAIVAWSHHGVTAEDSRRIISQVCARFEVPVPATLFHPRRSPHTGVTWAPRWHRTLAIGEKVAAAEEQGRPWPEHGEIRVGSVTAVSTLAHELGHHLVHHREPFGTAPHGKVFVGWFDQALAAVVKLLPHPGG